jgi:hypothetical protein
LASQTRKGLLGDFVHRYCCTMERQPLHGRGILACLPALKMMTLLGGVDGLGLWIAPGTDGDCGMAISRRKATYARTCSGRHATKPRLRTRSPPSNSLTRVVGGCTFGCRMSSPVYGKFMGGLALSRAPPCWRASVSNSQDRWSRWWHGGGVARSGRVPQGSCLQARPLSPSNLVRVTPRQPGMGRKWGRSQTNPPLPLVEHERLPMPSCRPPTVALPPYHLCIAAEERRTK